MPSLNDNDHLSEYMFRKSEMRSDGTPRPATIKPREGDMLSLFEITKLEHTEVCEHGHTHVDNNEKGRIHIGYVKYLKKSISNLGLEAIYDNVPPRHVSVKFPDEMEKRRELAKALSDKAVKNKTNNSFFYECS